MPIKAITKLPMQAALRYALHEMWREFLVFVQGEKFVNDDGGVN
jgi:hypothetical protein